MIFSWRSLGAWTILALGFDGMGNNLDIFRFVTHIYIYMENARSKPSDHYGNQSSNNAGWVTWQTINKTQSQVLYHRFRARLETNFTSSIGHYFINKAPFSKHLALKIYPSLFTVCHCTNYISSCTGSMQIIRHVALNIHL